MRTSTLNFATMEPHGLHSGREVTTHMEWNTCFLNRTLQDSRKCLYDEHVAASMERFCEGIFNPFIAH
jgi:hypothetical protein